MSLILLLIEYGSIYNEQNKIIYRHNDALQTQVNELFQSQEEDRQAMNDMKTSNIELQRSVNQLLKQIKTKERNTLQNVNFDKLTQRDTINEIYEFTYKFDGSIGETALQFRDNVVNYNNYVKNKIPKYYNENRIVIRLTKSLTDKAATKYANRYGPRIDTLNKFLEWFDITFKLNTLREELYNKLLNWQITPEMNNLSIVDEYKQKLNLFMLG